MDRIDRTMIIIHTWDQSEKKVATPLPTLESIS
jgi:hypothetical protein